MFFDYALLYVEKNIRLIAINNIAPITPTAMLYMLKPVTPGIPKRLMTTPPSIDPIIPTTTSRMKPCCALVFISTEANQPTIAPKITKNNKFKIITPFL